MQAVCRLNFTHPRVVRACTQLPRKRSALFRECTRCSSLCLCVAVKGFLLFSPFFSLKAACSHTCGCRALHCDSLSPRARAFLLPDDWIGWISPNCRGVLANGVAGRGDRKKHGFREIAPGLSVRGTNAAVDKQNKMMDEIRPFATGYFRINILELALPSPLRCSHCIADSVPTACLRLTDGRALTWLRSFVPGSGARIGPPASRCALYTRKKGGFDQKPRPSQVTPRNTGPPAHQLRPIRCCSLQL